MAAHAHSHQEVTRKKEKRSLSIENKRLRSAMSTEFLERVLNFPK